MTDWEWLSVRVLILGATIFLWSFITDIPGVLEMFGDDPIIKPGANSWGFRHFIYSGTFFIITIIQIFKLFQWASLVADANGFNVNIRD